MHSKFESSPLDVLKSIPVPDKRKSDRLTMSQQSHLHAVFILGLTDVIQTSKTNQSGIGPFSTTADVSVQH